MKRFAAIFALLVWSPAAMAGGFTPPPGLGGVKFTDPYTPSSGTFTVTGSVLASGSVQSTNTTGFVEGTSPNQLVIQYIGSGTHRIDTVGGSAQKIQIWSNTADGAGKVGVEINNQIQLTSASQALLDVLNNGVEAQRLTPNGGMVLGSSLTILSSSGFPQGTAVFAVTQGGVLSGNGGILIGGNAYTQTGANGIGTDASGNLDFNAKSGQLISALVAGSPAYIASATAVGRSDLIGQVDFSHAAGGSGVPTSATAGTGCGTSSAPTVSGNDFMGTIGVTCGGAGTAGNNFVTATFAHAYVTNAPACIFIPANATTETALVTSKEINNSTTTTLAVECGTGGTCPTGTLLWTYICSQQ